jgi:hypothetical protein
MRLDEPARKLRLDYAHVPADIGGIDVCIRELGSSNSLRSVWSSRLCWQYISRSIENHPVDLPAGDYEVAFNALEGWLEPPLMTRSLGFALSMIALEPTFEIAPSGIDMASPDAEQQLVSGWFEPERSAGRVYRWASAHAAAVVRIARGASRVRMAYRLPPLASEVKVAMRPLDRERPSWSVRIAWHDADWHEDELPARLSAGDYLLSVDAGAPWSNPGQRDPALPPENRPLGLALSSLSCS